MIKELLTMLKAICHIFSLIAIKGIFCTHHENNNEEVSSLHGSCFPKSKIKRSNYPVQNECVIKELEMVQSIIARLASNSFQLKGWTVTLVLGIFALANKNSSRIGYLLVYIPIVMFWMLDSYYLRKERQYRCLFNWVRKQEDDKIDFLLDVDACPISNRNTKYIYCLFACSECFFYLPLAAIAALVIYYI